MIEKKVQPLTKETFARFGQVIDTPADIRVEPGAVHGWARVATAHFAGEVEVGWLKLMHRAMDVTQMERHTETPEIIIPLDVPLMIPVAPPADAAGTVPVPSEIDGFLVKPGQALLMDRSAWHWLPFPLAETGSCLIIFRKDTPANDLLIRNLENDQVVRIVL